MKQLLLVCLIFLAGFFPAPAAQAQTSIVDNGIYTGADANAALANASAACVATTGSASVCGAANSGGLTYRGSCFVTFTNATPAAWYGPANCGIGPQSSSVLHRWRWSAAACVSPKVANPDTGLCEDPPPVDECPPGQVSGPFGICTADPQPNERPCRNVLGYVNGVEVCQDKKDECEAQGGSYGIIMDDEGCLIGEEDPEKECVSETFIFGNEFGGYVCVHPDPKPPTPPGETPPPSCPSGYIAVGGSCIIDEPDKEGDDDEDGVPNGNEPDRGAGQCDPTSVAYAECVGQMTQVSGNEGEGIRNNANRAGSSALDGVVGAAKSAIGNGDAGFSEPTSLVEDLTGFAGFSPGSCSDLAVDVFGHAMAIECVETQRWRDVASWVVAFLTLLYIVNLALLRPAS